LRVGGRGVEDEIEVDPKRRGLRHDMSDLALETVEESRAFGEVIVLVLTFCIEFDKGLGGGRASTPD
jgi:hypothetical protein